MNLHEIFKTDWVENLSESLNARFDSAAWSLENGIDVGIGDLGSERFKIMIQPQIYSLDGRTYQFVNVSFAKIVGNAESEELQLDSTNASKIIGAVTNAIHDRTKKYELDAIVFIAQDNVEKRMRLYNIIARKKWSRLGTIIENIDIGGGRRLTAMISKDLSKHINAFKTHLAGLSK
jgi:hypothetical protein